MSLRLSVGSSPLRTPIKHALDNLLMGTIVGAAEMMNGIDKCLIIDACAGDGGANEFSGLSSPEIAVKHLRYAATHKLQARGFLVEKDPYTFAELERRFGDEPLVKCVFDDYRSDAFAQMVEADRQTVAFLHIDPNHANEVEFPQALFNRLPTLTTMLSTWGCNAGGLKRLPQEPRIEWAHRMYRFISKIQPFHDAALVALMKDEAQWAYLLSVPRKWRDKTQRPLQSLAKAHWHKGIDVRWWRDGFKQFDELVQQLFLTAAERKGAQGQLW